MFTTPSLDQYGQYNPYELPVWEHPEDYGGFSPDGDFVIYAKHRDSDLLTETNYDGIWKALSEKEEQTVCFVEYPEEERDRTDRANSFVYTFTARHWAVGWVEYMLLRSDTPDHLQKEAAEILGALENYPVLDDEAFSEAEHEAQDEAWENYVRREVTTALSHYPDPTCRYDDLDAAVDASDLDLRSIFDGVMETANIYWETTNDGTSICWALAEADLVKAVSEAVRCVFFEEADDKTLRQLARAAVACAALLNEQEWNADTLDALADILRNSGMVIGDNADYDEGETQ